MASTSAAADAGGALDRRARRLFDRLGWFRLVEAHCPPPGPPARRPRPRRRRAAWLFLAERGRPRPGLPLLVQPSLRPRSATRAARSRSQGRLRKRLHRLEIFPLEDPEPLAARLSPRRLGDLRSARPPPPGGSTRPARISRLIGRPVPASCATPPSARRRRPGSTSRSTATSTPPPGPTTNRSTRPAGSPRRARPPSFARWPSRKARPGRLRLGIARKDGAPLAAQLWLVEDGAAWIHKLAYREDAKALSPGTVLSMAMFRAALDEDRVEPDRLRHRRRALQARLDGRAGDPVAARGVRPALAPRPGRRGPRRGYRRLSAALRSR